MRKVEHICAEEIKAIDACLRLRGDVVALARALGVGRLSEGARARLEDVLTNRH
jgi:hypothetical protein